MSKLDCIVLGRIAVDINPIDMSQSFAECHAFGKYVGGSAANTAIGLARLGTKTGFFGKISQDSLGHFCMDYMKDAGVDMSHVTYAEEGRLLGLAFTETLNGRTNLMMYRDANTADLLITPEDIDEEYLAEARCLVVSGTALSASPSRDAVFRALELAQKHDVKVVFDIDYRPQVWKSKEEISEMYMKAAEYAHIILGSKEEYDLMDANYKTNMDDRETADFWFARKAETIVIKHGMEGSMGYTKDGDVYKVNIIPVHAVKSTGGGDAYASSFLWSYLKGNDLKYCLELATASASIAVGKAYCSDALPNETTLTQFLEDSRAKYGDPVTKLQ